MADNSAEPGRSVTSKINAILVTFTQGCEYSLTEDRPARRLSTTRRLASELAAQGLLGRTRNGLYRAGVLFADDRAAGWVNRPSLIERAPRVLEDLAAATGSRTRQGVLRELEVSYIEKRPG